VSIYIHFIVKLLTVQYVPKKICCKVSNLTVCFLIKYRYLVTMII